MMDILSLIKDKTGLAPQKLALCAWPEVANKRRLELGLSWLEYYQLLQKDKVELAKLVEQLTVGESYFFRHRRQLCWLVEEYFPVSSQLSQGALRIWSAGCASGEEPYSLAIMLSERPPARRYTIYASDLNNQFLARARIGLYNAWALRTLSAAEKVKYFLIHNNRYQLRESYRRQVQFFQYNLAGTELLPIDLRQGVDVILCRNVFIYLTEKAVRNALQLFYRVLKPGGVLVLAPTDHLPDCLSFQAQKTAGGIVYLKAKSEQAKQTQVSQERPDHSRPVRETAINPDLPDLRQARQLADRKQWQEALELLERMPEQETGEVYYLKGLVYSETDHLLEAEQALRRAVYLDPLNYEANLLLGLVLLRLNCPQEGETYLSRAERLREEE